MAADRQTAQSTLPQGEARQWCTGGVGEEGGGQVTLCMLRDVVRRGGDQPSWTRAVRVALPLMHPIATRLEISGERECVT